MTHFNCLFVLFSLLIASTATSKWRNKRVKAKQIRQIENLETAIESASCEEIIPMLQGQWKALPVIFAYEAILTKCPEAHDQEKVVAALMRNDRCDMWHTGVTNGLVEFADTLLGGSIEKSKSDEMWINLMKRTSQFGPTFPLQKMKYFAMIDYFAVYGELSMSIRMMELWWDKITHSKIDDCCCEEIDDFFNFISEVMTRANVNNGVNPGYRAVKLLEFCYERVKDDSERLNVWIRIVQGIMSADWVWIDFSDYSMVIKVMKLWYDGIASEHIAESSFHEYFFWGTVTAKIIPRIDDPQQRAIFVHSILENWLTVLNEGRTIALLDLWHERVRGDTNLNKTFFDNARAIIELKKDWQALRHKCG